MPAEKAPMRKVREVLRLRHALGVSGLDFRGARVGFSPSRPDGFRYNVEDSQLARPVCDKFRLLSGRLFMNLAARLWKQSADHLSSQPASAFRRDRGSRPPNSPTSPSIPSDCR